MSQERVFFVYAFLLGSAFTLPLVIVAITACIACYGIIFDWDVRA